MVVLAGLVGGVFAALHAAGGVASIAAPAAPRGSGENGAVPIAARYLWLALAVVGLIGGAALALSGAAAAFVVMAIGVVGLVVLAIANGVWMHGTPTWSHHVVRGVAAALVLALGLVAVG